MKSCAILDDYQNVALKMADWSKISHSIRVRSYQKHFYTEQELIKEIKQDEVVVVMRERTPFTESIFEKLPNLKLLITSGMRNSSIDLQAASKHGVIVSGTKNYSDPPVELTWGLIHVLARNIIKEHESIKSGHWQNTIGVDLMGKQLGILGLGNTGSKMAKIAQAFGMNVVAWSENLTQDRAEKEGVILSKSKDELLKTSDFVSIHLILSARTKNLLTEKDFSLMKKTSYLINTSRAGIVDQQAMIHALKNKKIAGAAADVFESEPLPENHILRNLDNFIATPHIGYVTEKNYRTYFGEAVENIEFYLKRKPLRQLNNENTFLKPRTY